MPVSVELLMEVKGKISSIRMKNYIDKLGNLFYGGEMYDKY